MTKIEANRQLKIGYILLPIGFFCGLGLTKPLGLDYFYSGLFTAYAFWGVYWGYKIVQRPVKNFFSEIHIFETQIVKAIYTHILFKFVIIVITFISAYTVGLLGGGIYKQVKLMNIK